MDRPSRIPNTVITSPGHTGLSLSNKERERTSNVAVSNPVQYPIPNPTLFRNICSAISACSELKAQRHDPPSASAAVAVRFNPPSDIAAHQMIMIRICPDLTATAATINRTPLHVAAGSKVSASLIKLIARAYPAACVVMKRAIKTPLHFACDSSCELRAF
ncbi:hypothetical protein ACHAWT_005102 [Skeletonema menzelii]